MHIPGLRQRIPDDVRDHAERAEFREPDFYVGPLIAEDDRKSVSSGSGDAGELETQMQATEGKATSKTAQERSEKESLVRRLQRRLFRRPRLAR